MEDPLAGGPAGRPDHAADQVGAGATRVVADHRADPEGIIARTKILPVAPAARAVRIASVTIEPDPGHHRRRRDGADRGRQLSRNTFRTRVWRPAVKASGVDFDVRVHDLRRAHASWLLAGGSDLKSVMDRMGHAQITTPQKYLHAMPGADAKNLDALNRVRGKGSNGAAGDEPGQAD